jgi:transcriptional regulator with XRE-family HTH domain
MRTRTAVLRLRRALARELRLQRQKCHLTQEQLAFKADLHRNYISLLERGMKSPTVDALARIANALEAEPSRLLSRAEAFAEQEA